MIEHRPELDQYPPSPGPADEPPWLLWIAAIAVAVLCVLAAGRMIGAVLK